eukprot:3657582-Prymnesium_polylepis.1
MAASSVHAPPSYACHVSWRMRCFPQLRPVLDARNPFPWPSLPKVPCVQRDRVAGMPEVVAVIVHCQVATEGANKSVLQKTGHPKHILAHRVVCRPGTRLNCLKGMAHMDDRP